jgi:hypothetical protein
LNEYVVNTGSWASFETDLLQTTVTNGQLPKDSPVHLTTDDLGLLIPALKAKYGSGKDVNLELKATSFPELKLTTQNL